MIYEYYCEKCDKSIEADFEMGKAKKKINCECGNVAYRDFSNQSFKCDGPTGNMKFKKEMTKRNEEAGRKMRGTWEGTQPKLVQQ